MMMHDLILRDGLMFSYFTSEAMTDRVGVIMFSHEQLFHNTELQEKWLKKNVVFPTTKTTDAAIQPGSFFYDMKPLFQLYRLLGRFPAHMKDSGNIEQRVVLIVQPFLKS
jgi:hypothetical protein